MHETRFCPWCAAPVIEREHAGAQRKACPNCHFVEYQDPKVAVAALVPWQGGLLLGKRAISPGKGAWSFPSGYVDRGEVLEEAAAREVLEETGLQTRINDLVGAYSEAGQAVILIVYEAEIISGDPHPSDEMSELAAFQPTRLPTLAFPHDQRIIADWAARQSVKQPR